VCQRQERPGWEASSPARRSWDRIPLRRRLRAAYRGITVLLGQLAASQGHDSTAREDFLQLAAREARERAEAIDASVGAMSAADIQRVTEPRQN
jgi:hypothetical protein